MGLLAPLAAAQELVWERVGGEGGELSMTQALERRIATIGDVNGDGHHDLLNVVHTFDPPTGRWQEPELWILSGKDGRTLRTRRRFGESFSSRPYREIAAAGDVDGDGVPDYAATVLDTYPPIEPTLVLVRSGRNDALLLSIAGPPTVPSFGAAVLGGVDLEGTGRPGLVVTAPQEAPYGALYAYRPDGTLLYRVPGSVSMQFRFQGGRVLGRLGDLDGDGAEDFVVGALDNAVGLGAAAVLSGPSGQVLLKVLGPPYENLGHAVAGAGDLDADGVPDFFASSDGFFHFGVVVAYSGRTGEALHTWVGPHRGSEFGAAIASNGLDLDQDGVPDVVVGAPNRFHPPTWRGSVLVFSGRDGAQLHRIDSEPGINGFAELGNFLDVVPPSPESPFPMLVVTEPDYGVYRSRWNTTIPAGRVRLFRGAPAGVKAYGEACAGTLGAAPRIGVRTNAPAMRLHLSKAPPGAPAFLLLGFSSQSFLGHPLPWSLGAYGLPGCSLYTSVEALLPVTTGVTGIAAGYAAVDVPMPLGVTPMATPTLHGQWLALPVSGQGGAVSAALVWD